MLQQNRTNSVVGSSLTFPTLYFPCDGPTTARARTDSYRTSTGGYTATADVSKSADCKPYDSPIALDLDGSGAIEVGTQPKNFDLDADGEAEGLVEWFAGSGDGILYDATIEGAMSGAMLFGNEGDRYPSGYEKLAAWDTDGNGILTGSELDGLAVWIDDGNARFHQSESATLAEVAVVSIDLTYDENYASTAGLADGNTPSSRTSGSGTVTEEAMSLGTTTRRFLVSMGVTVPAVIVLGSCSGGTHMTDTTSSPTQDGVPLQVTLEGNDSPFEVTDDQSLAPLQVAAQGLPVSFDVPVEVAELIVPRHVTVPPMARWSRDPALKAVETGDMLYAGRIADTSVDVTVFSVDTDIHTALRSGCTSSTGTSPSSLPPSLPISPPVMAATRWDHRKGTPISFSSVRSTGTLRSSCWRPTVSRSLRYVPGHGWPCSTHSTSHGRRHSTSWDTAQPGR